MSDDLNFSEVQLFNFFTNMIYSLIIEDLFLNNLKQSRGESESNSGHVSTDDKPLTTGLFWRWEMSTPIFVV